MELNKKLIRFNKYSHFKERLDAKDISPQSVVFIVETGQIWTQGEFFGGHWDHITGQPTTFTPSAHKHGSITNDGKIGTLANRIIETTTGGSLTHVAKNTAYNKDFGTGKNQVAMGNHTHDYLPLSGGKLTGNLEIFAGNTDKFIKFAYNTTDAYAWRIGYLGTGTGNENRLAFQSAKTSGASYVDALSFGLDDLVGKFAVTPTVGNTKVSLEGHNHTLKLIAGASTATTDSTADVANPYIRLFSDNAHQGNIRIVGGTNVGAVSKNGVITLTATNTTYSAGTLALLQTGTNTSNRVWSAKILNDWLNPKLNDKFDKTGGTLTGSVAGTVFTLDRYIPSPQGGRYTTSTTTMTGAIKITLPLSWNSTMLRFAVDVYNYSTNTSFTVYVGGYNYSGGNSWINTFAYILARDSSADYTVRFGHDGSKCCVYIGETNKSWSYPQIVVRDVHLGYSGGSHSSWDTGWSIGFATSFGTISSTISDCMVYSRYAKTAGSVAWGNVTGKPGTFAPSTHTHSNISITAGNGLTGGGALSADRTLSIASTYAPNTSTSLGASKNLNDYRTAGFYHQTANANATTALNYPVASAGSLLVQTAAGVIQTYKVYNSSNVYVRGYYGTTWTAWRKLALVTDNVASATKLKTSRTIWGQSFNGEGNVSGALSGASTGSFSSTLSANRIVVTSTSNEKHLEFSRSDYNYVTSKGHLGFITNNTATGSAAQQLWLHTNGNTKIGAGSSSAPAYKLDVSGTGRFTSNVNIEGALNITGATGYSEGIRIKGVGGISSIWFNAVSDSGYDPKMYGLTVGSAGLRFRYGTGSTPSDIASIDNTGKVTATKFIGSLTGNASSASAVSTSAENSNATSRYILFANNASGNQALKTDSGLKYVPSTNTISATFSGNLTGNVTGDITGSAGSTTNWAGNTYANSNITNEKYLMTSTNGTYWRRTLANRYVDTISNQSIGGNKSFNNYLQINGSTSIDGHTLNIFLSGSRARMMYGESTTADRKVAFGGGWGTIDDFAVFTKTSGSFSAATQRFTVKMNGNVGIGTTAPAYKLDVSGTGRFTGNVTVPTISASTSVSTPHVSNGERYIRHTSGSNTIISSESAGMIYLRPNGDSNSSNQVTINGSGTVTAPTFSGALTGNASSATYASAVKLTADNSSNATRYPLFASSATGNLSPRTDTGFKYNPSTGALTSTSFVGNLTGNAGSATVADTVRGNTTTITITGDANTYYPVTISVSNRKTLPNRISVWKNLSSLTNSSYSGNHSNGTSSLWLQYESRTTVWDGNGGYHFTRYKSQPYATLVSHAAAAANSSGVLVVWLRGGGTLYNIASDSPSLNVNVYYSSTSIGSNATVEPRTTIGNGGIFSSGYTAYVSTTGNSATATTLRNARTINGTSFNGSANITTTNWGTTRTITIGSKGKSVNGGGNVSWTLAEIGAAPTSHTHSGYDVKTLGHRLTVDSDGKVRVNNSSYRRAGMYGIYDSNKIGHIWSMGNSYQIAADGANFGNLYGLAYKHTNNSTGGTMGGGHQVVWATNGNPTVSLGSNVWTSGGFLKNGSSDSYALLGGGGHTALSNLTNNTGIRVGASGNASNTAVTDPYVKVSDNGTYREQFRIKGGSNVTVKSDASKNITITATNTNTHYITGIRAGASGTTTNAAVTNPYIKVLDDTEYRSQIRLKGGGATTVSSDASGNITIRSTDNNTVYSHPTGDGNLHVPKTGTTNSGRVLKAGATAGSISWGTLGYGDVGAAPASHTHSQYVEFGINGGYKIISGADYVFSEGLNVGNTLRGDKITCNTVSATGNISSGGQISAAYGFFQTSDIRLKNIIKPLKININDILNVPSFYFKYKGKNEINIGTSAQEVQKVFPEIVSTNSKGTLSVEYDKFGLIALELIKTQQKEIDYLKYELNNLKLKIDGYRN